MIYKKINKNNKTNMKNTRLFSKIFSNQSVFCGGGLKRNVYMNSRGEVQNNSVDNSGDDLKKPEDIKKVLEDKGKQREFLNAKSAQLQKELQSAVVDGHKMQLQDQIKVNNNQINQLDQEIQKLGEDLQSAEKAEEEAAQRVESGTTQLKNAKAKEKKIDTN